MNLYNFFHELRNTEGHHLGLGDVRLTVSQQDTITNATDASVEHAFYEGYNAGFSAAMVPPPRKTIEEDFAVSTTRRLMQPNGQGNAPHEAHGFSDTGRRSR